MRRFRPRGDRQPRCARAGGKVILRDEIAAKIALARMARKDRDEQRVYRCPGTSHFHLTSMPLTVPVRSGS